MNDCKIIKWPVRNSGLNNTDTKALGMPFVFDDGGRAAAGHKGHAGDCCCRAIAIATGLPYGEVYKSINKLAKRERLSIRRLKSSAARTGVHKDTVRNYMSILGWAWKPTMLIGQGCKVHLRSEELPAGRVIAAVSKHLVAVIDGVIHDTYDCSRGGTRCVYGYFVKEPQVSDELNVTAD